jgi:hypothetical protein
MPLNDLISTNISALMEIVTLALIVTGFFRWYDAKYNKMVIDAKSDIHNQINDVKQTLCNQISDLSHQIERLQDTLSRHLDKSA